MRMSKRITCPKCSSILEYDDRSVYEGNRDFEDFDCPICGYTVATVFTDSLPVVHVISKKESWNK